MQHAKWSYVLFIDASVSELRLRVTCCHDITGSEHAVETRLGSLVSGDWFDQNLAMLGDYLGLDHEESYGLSPWSTPSPGSVRVTA